MKLYSGQTVKVKTYGVRPGRWNHDGLMDKYMGKIVTIDNPNRYGSGVKIWEDDGKWTWRPQDFENIYYTDSDLKKITKIFLEESLFEI